jgi:hypothetical protein
MLTLLRSGLVPLVYPSVDLSVRATTALMMAAGRLVDFTAEVAGKVGDP